MTLRIPFTISNQSLTFYVKGKPYSVTKDQAAYAELKSKLQATGDHDVEELLALVDVRKGLIRSSYGEIQIIGDEIIWRGQALHNIWVDRIFEFQAAGEPFDPLWNALRRLVTNPTPEAIERLPNFLERCKLGFLDDGRFVAFKGVKANYWDAHTGNTFRNMVGDKPSMDRAEVDPDPNATCSRGLHVGAPGYVGQYYGATDQRIMLVAVAPEDVVCVPTDYNGEKMRVCAYEVIDEVDAEYRAELLSKIGTRVTGYTTSVPDEVDPYPEGDEAEDESEDLDEGDSDWDDPEADDSVKFATGDVVEYEDLYATLYGVMVSDTKVRGLDGDPNDPCEIVRVLDPGELTAAVFVTEKALIRVEGDPLLRDGDYTVIGYSDDDADTQLDDDSKFWRVKVEGVDGGVPVTNSSIKVVNLVGEHLWPLPRVEVTDNGDGTVELRSLDGQDLRGQAEALILELPTPAERAVVGDSIEVVGGWPPNGIYPVVRVDEGAEYRLTVQTLHDGEQGVLNRYVTRVIKS